MIDTFSELLLHHKLFPCMPLRKVGIVCLNSWRLHTLFPGNGTIIGRGSKQYLTHCVPWWPGNYNYIPLVHLYFCFCGGGDLAIVFNLVSNFLNSPPINFISKSANSIFGVKPMSATNLCTTSSKSSYKFLEGIASCNFYLYRRRIYCT